MSWRYDQLTAKASTVASFITMDLQQSLMIRGSIKRLDEISHVFRF